MELKSERRSINGTWNEIFCAFKHAFFHPGEMISLLRLLLERIRQNADWMVMLLCCRDWIRLETQTLPSGVAWALRQQTWLWHYSDWRMHKRNEFASNLIRKATRPPTTPPLKDFWTLAPWCDEERLYANLGLLCQWPSCVYFPSVIAANWTFWSLGGFKRLYQPHPSVNKDTHTSLHHTRSAPPIMPKNTNLVANSRGSHDDYQVIYLACLQHWELI